MWRSCWPSDPSEPSRMPTSMIRRVAAIAKMPSAKVSRRPGLTPRHSSPLWLRLLQLPLVQAPHLIVQDHEADLVEAVREVANGAEGDGCSQLDGIAVDPRGERRKGDRSATELLRDLERASVRRGQELRLARESALPDRA